MNKKTWIINILTIAISFVFILFLNRSFAYCTDDYHFQFVFKQFDPAPGDVRMETIGDTFVSAKNYYGYSGGRIFAHEMTFLVHLLPEGVVDLLNSAMFVLLGFLMYLIIKRELGGKWWLMPSIFLSIIFCTYSFGDNYIWIAGAVNYLWMAVVNCVSILYIRDNFESDKIYKKLLLVLLCLLAGMTNEVTGGMLLILLAGWLIATRKLKKENFVTIISCAVAIIIGMAVVVLAPGNANRQMGNGTYGFNFLLVKECFLNYIRAMIYFSWPFIIISVTGMIIEFRKKSFTSFLCDNRWFLAGLAGNMVLCFSNAYYTRAQLMPALMLIVAGFNSLSIIIEEIKGCKSGGEESVSSFRSICCKLIIAFCIVFSASLLCDALTTENWVCKDLSDMYIFWLGLVIVISLLAILCARPEAFKILSKYIKVAAVFIVLLLMIINVKDDLGTFAENSQKQSKYTVKIEEEVIKGNNKIKLIRYPSYKTSRFWPWEASYSPLYSAEWMEVYFKSEHGIEN